MCTKISHHFDLSMHQGKQNGRTKIHNLTPFPNGSQNEIKILNFFICMQLR
jgi:hypothetical protein